MWLPDVERGISIVPVTPWYDAGSRLWFADIHVTAGRESYRPFVDLRVARYQPVIVTPQSQLSGTVSTGMIQLLPDRHLELNIRENRVDVTLNGNGPGSPEHEGFPKNEVRAWLEAWTGDPGVSGDFVTLTGGANASWQRLGGTAVSAALNSSVSIPMPGHDPRPRRIVICEFDATGYPADANVSEDLLRRRTVFLETILLPTHSV